jgi:hypothetical protein
MANDRNELDDLKELISSSKRVNTQSLGGYSLGSIAYLSMNVKEITCAHILIIYFYMTEYVNWNRGGVV